MVKVLREGNEKRQFKDPQNIPCPPPPPSPTITKKASIGKKYIVDEKSK